MNKPRDLPRNDIPLLVLSVLEGGPLHGYAIARAIEQQSENALTLREGSLYPALRSLETDTFVVGTWEFQPSGPARKTYHLTDEGKKELSNRRQEWERYARVVGRIVQGAFSPQPPLTPHEQPA